MRRSQIFCKECGGRRYLSMTVKGVQKEQVQGMPGIEHLSPHAQKESMQGLSPHRPPYVCHMDTVECASGKKQSTGEVIWQAKGGKDGIADSSSDASSSVDWMKAAGLRRRR